MSPLMVVVFVERKTRIVETFRCMTSTEKGAINNIAKCKNDLIIAQSGCNRPNFHWHLESKNIFLKSFNCFPLHKLYKFKFNLITTDMSHRHKLIAIRLPVLDNRSKKSGSSLNMSWMNYCDNFSFSIIYYRKYWEMTRCKQKYNTTLFFSKSKYL